MTNHKIAVFLTDFTLKKNADTFFQRYSEPYFVSLTLVGEEEKRRDIFPAKPMIYPNVRKNGKITFAGEGHLLAKPKAPTDGYVFFSILFMESDSDMRKIGDVFKQTTKTIWEASKDAIKADPSAYIAASIGRGILESLAIGFSENSDDQLFRLSGTFLESSDPSYSINEHHRFGNDWIDCGITVRSFSDKEYEEFKKSSSYKNFEKLQSEYSNEDSTEFVLDELEFDNLVHKLSVQE